MLVYRFPFCALLCCSSYTALLCLDLSLSHSLRSVPGCHGGYGTHALHIGRHLGISVEHVLRDVVYEARLELCELWQDHAVGDGELCSAWATIGYKWMDLMYGWVKTEREACQRKRKSNMLKRNANAIQTHCKHNANSKQVDRWKDNERRERGAKNHLGHR